MIDASISKLSLCQARWWFDLFDDS